MSEQDEKLLILLWVLICIVIWSHMSHNMLIGPS